MKRSDRSLRALLPLALLIGLLAGLAGPRTLTGRAAPHTAPQYVTGGSMVISEFQTESAAGSADEFIEIFNRTGSTLDITGWTIRMIDDQGNSTGQVVLDTTGSTTLGPGEHRLIVNAAASAALVALKDWTYTGDITNNGAIALFSGSAPTSQKMDGVALSGPIASGLYGEGTELAVTSTTTPGYERNSAGCADTNDNVSDFAFFSTPTPQNNSSAHTPCTAAIPPVAIFTTTTTIGTVTPNSTGIGAPYTVPFTVIANGAGAPVPTGNVTVSDGTDSCTVALPALNCSLTSTTAGNKTLTATYAGDANFFGSVSAGVAHTVTTPTTPLSPTPSPSPSITPTPVPGFLSVVINEVAWSGTRADADHEWIELYNPTTRDINLTGWYIQVTSFDRRIELSSKTIKAGGFYLLERFEEATTVTADQVTEWELLDDDFEILTLWAPGNRLIDQTYATRGQWPAGTVTNTRSMERRSTNTTSGLWVTYNGIHVNTDPKDNAGNFINGTPGRANWNLSVTLTPSATPTKATTRIPTRTKPPQPRPVLNEFLPRASFDWNQDGRVDVFDEFVEVANIGPVDWNTSGWRLDTGPDTEAFPLPAMAIKPGERALFYGLQSRLHLSDGGATVRLLNSSGVVYDAQTYTVVKNPDKSWCRIKDLSGSWFSDCFPTPNFPNSREGNLPSLPPGTGLETPLCRLADTLPQDFILAECRAYGDSMWNSLYWDKAGWRGDRFVPQTGSKWGVFIE